MKKRATLLAGLAAVFMLACFGVAAGLAQDSDLSYGSFDSFDPSEDFKGGAPKPPSAPPPSSAPAQSGRAGSGLPEPAAEGSPPARSGFDIAEPGYYDSAPPAAPSPRAAHSGFDLSEPGTYEEPEAAWAAEESPAAPQAPAAPASAPAPARAAASAPAPPVSAVPPVALSAAVNYGLSDNWLALPASPDLQVDVFFLYTGSCSRVGQGGAVCSPNDPDMRRKAGESLRRQAGVFETVANIYAPYYRQVNASVFLGLGPEDRAGRLAVSVSDSLAAFDHYLKNYNQGRPYILAAHGQGSAAMLAGILAEYLRSNPEAGRRMVAAYVPGYSVTSDYLSANAHLRFAQRRDDTGVIISYNTEAPGLTAPSPVVLPRAVAINPVNWARSEIPAPADRSLGANLSAFGGEEMTEKFADARISLRRGVVECSSADPEQYSSDLFPFGAYPEGDYAFYFHDLRANARERAEAFLRGRAR